MTGVFAQQVVFAKKLRTSTLASRIEILKKLEFAVRRRQEEILDCLQFDFSKAPTETLLTEVLPLLSELDFCLRHLKSWMKPKKVATPLLLFGSISEIVLEPRGSCLIIAPWNYPFYLALAPLVAAIAAGNTVILKPSELTAQTSRLIASICAEVFPPEHVAVFLGGKEVSEELLKLKFDHIFFTGSTTVGKLVMRAAAENLTTVTLELGGKSPTVVDSTCDIEWAAKKIAWGKSVNAGQTCVAPDYVFVHQSVFEKFKTLYLQNIEMFYPASSFNQDFARIINRNHGERLASMLAPAELQGASTVLKGAAPNHQQRMLPAVVDLRDKKIHFEKLSLMTEEIFGPILPLLCYENIEEVIEAINFREKPLALYIFSKDKVTQRRLIESTSSGGVVVNDVLVHLLNPNLPFGGVNQSGHGSYHGYYGFRAFSHEKAVLRQGIFGRLLAILFPPYTPVKERIAEFLVRFRIH
ncbi:MAG: aldehyde dehydrogenase family protein [Bdellovibrionaceae bacterium]|nr:aldehyde dehydrogenase family protein [Pseudobdellovibrionaceae bacterium]